MKKSILPAFVAVALSIVFINFGVFVTPANLLRILNKRDLWSTRLP